jgi:hypothetical protein
MTIESEDGRRAYAGNGVTTTFAVPWKFFDNGDITVILQSDEGVDATLEENVHYALTGAGDESGGEVDLDMAPAIGETLTVLLDPDLVQPLDYVANDPFPAEAHERGLDRLTQQNIRTRDMVQRCLRGADGDALPSFELPGAGERASKFLRFDSNGNPEMAAGLDQSATLSSSTIATTLNSLKRTASEVAAGITPTDYAYQPGDVRRYGALLNGSADDSAAFKAAHDALPTVGGRFIVPGGIMLIKDVEWTASDCFIQCDGILKHASASTGYLIKIGSSSITPARVKGYLKFDSQTNESAFGAVVSAVRIAALIESDLTLDCDGFVYGADCLTEGPVAYNKFHLLNMLNNRRAVYIRPGATGYCNRNDWYGGRFALASGVAFDDQWSIYIEDSGANTPNDNQFWSPSFEGKAGAFYNEGFSNHVHQSRLEITTSGTPGTDFADPYIDQQGSGFSKFTASYTQQMSAMTKDLGAGTRQDDHRFTLAGTDYTEYCFPGARIYVTVSGVVYECTVYSSSFSTDTTVRVVEAFITGNPTAIRPLLIKKASGAECEWFWSNDDIAGVSDAQTQAINRLLLHFIRSSLMISSFDANHPALRLRPGSSATDIVEEIVDLSGVRQHAIDGNGNIFNSLPTSNPVVAGQWWSDSGTVKISSG